MDIRNFAGGRRPENNNADQPIEEIVKKYEGRSESELMRELMESVASGKKDGSFTDEKLSEFMSKVSPMLNSEQKKRLAEITERLK